MWHVLIKGGWMMIPIALCSVVAVAIIIDRCFLFRRIKGPSRADEVIGLVAKGRIEEAMRAADGMAATRTGLPVIRVLSAGITHSFAPAGAMEAAAAMEVSLMKRGLTALDTIITLSPLLGLLGTIIGMIDAFNVMATAGLGQPHAVTGGVAEALVCTAAGISVAVVTLIPYNYFLACTERQMDVIETAATRLELALGASTKSCRGIDPVREALT
jgi:biopolymer transport protein ExbB